MGQPQEKSEQSIEPQRAWPLCSAADCGEYRQAAGAANM